MKDICIAFEGTTDISSALCYSRTKKIKTWLLEAAPLTEGNMCLSMISDDSSNHGHQ